jgi:hypothetical protein
MTRTPLLMSKSSQFHFLNQPVLRLENFVILFSVFRISFVLKLFNYIYAYCDFDFLSFSLRTHFQKAKTA